MQKGFTLIELIIVVAIIGILSSVVLCSLQTARNKDACKQGDIVACEKLGENAPKPNAW